METARGMRDVYPVLTKEQKRKVEKKVLMESSIPMLEEAILMLEGSIKILSLREFETTMLNRDVSRLRRYAQSVREGCEKL